MSKLLIQLQDIRKTYFKKRKPIKHAVKGMSFDLFQGEVLCLLGVNGSGKTTLSTILAGLHPPCSGDIIWKGRSIYKDILNYRKNVGFCPQKPNIDKTLTIEENLRFAARCYGFSKQEAEKRKDRVMDMLDLKSYAKSSADHLSGGYKQRFLIARSFIHNPKFLILDEPTVGLDIQIRKQLWEIIIELRKSETTVLLTTHYLEEAEKLSDRVCFIDEGEVKALNTPENLYKSFGKTKLEEIFLYLLEKSEEENV